MFFAALLVPLIQNMGITILQARNQMKFRSLLYVGIAVVSLIGQILLSRKFGAYGCAISIAAALFIGQGVVMNIYYQKRQRLDIKNFWREILKMSIVPVALSAIGYFVFQHIKIQTYTMLFICAVVFSFAYIPCFWFFSMNNYERQLIKGSLKRILPKHLK